MESTQGIRIDSWLRLINLGLLLLGILEIQNFVSGNTTKETLIRLALYAAAFACVPLVYKARPSSHKQPISTTRWLFVAALFFIMLVASNFSSPLQHSFLDKYPHLKETLSQWLLPVFLVVICLLALVLRHRAPHVAKTPTQAWPFRLGSWIAAVLLGLLLFFLASHDHLRSEGVLKRIFSIVFSSGGSWTRPVALISAGVALMLFRRHRQDKK